MATKKAPAVLRKPTASKQLDGIYIKGARGNNLKNVNLMIPRDKLVVVTGVSGSGKSSITMDTLYAEGQRRYVESLSSYARQFLMRIKKPEVDYIKGICPAIAIGTWWWWWRVWWNWGPEIHPWAERDEFERGL